MRVEVAVVSKRREMRRFRRSSFEGRNRSYLVVGKKGKKTFSSNETILETGKFWNEGIADLDDVSLSSDGSNEFRKFLKKDYNQEIELSPREGKPPSNEHGKSRSIPDRVPEPVAVFSSSNALNRLAAIEAKIMNRKGKEYVDKYSLSGSDSDLDVSYDLEIEDEIRMAGVKLREKKKQEENDPDHATFLRNNSGTHDADSNHSILGENLNMGTNQISLKTFTSGLMSNLNADLENSLNDLMVAGHIDYPNSLEELRQDSIHNVISLDDLLPSKDTNLCNKAESGTFEQDVRSASDRVSSLIEEMNLNDESDRPKDRAKATAYLLPVENREFSSNFDNVPVFGEVISAPKISKTAGSPVAVEEMSVLETISTVTDEYSEDFCSEVEDDDSIKSTDSIQRTVTGGSSIHSSLSISNQSNNRSKLGSSSVYDSERTSSFPAALTPNSLDIRMVSVETQTDMNGSLWIPSNSFFSSFLG